MFSRDAKLPFLRHGRKFRVDFYGGYTPPFILFAHESRWLQPAFGRRSRPDKKPQQDSYAHSVRHARSSRMVRLWLQSLSSSPMHNNQPASYPPSRHAERSHMVGLWFWSLLSSSPQRSNQSYPPRTSLDSTQYCCVETHPDSNPESVWRQTERKECVVL